MFPEQKEDSFLTSPQPSSPPHSGCCANNRSAVLSLHPTLLELGAQGHVKAQPQSPETLTPGFGVEEEEREDLLPPQCYHQKQSSCTFLSLALCWDVHHQYRVVFLVDMCSRHVNTGVHVAENSYL